MDLTVTLAKEGTLVIMDTQPTLHLLSRPQVEGAPGRVERLLACFSPVNLSEMERVSLLDRIDTKYVLGMHQLYAAMEMLSGQYRVLEIKRMRLSRYQTIYFDTPEFDLYRQHHNGFGTRYKIRTRRYAGSNLAFFEIKHKTSQGRTIKSRFQIPSWQAELDEREGGFVSALTPIDPDQLEPKLWNDYLRMTLVSMHRQERLTIDLNLAFGWGDAQVALPGVAIAEVKQERASSDSAFVQQMRALGIHSSSFSKYCMGACMLYDHLKNNNFKPHLRQLYRVMERELEYDFMH